MPLGWEPRAQDFPRRNRLISGLALGVVVVEAAKRSGSLITVRFALEQGREVFAVPGSPLDPRAEGSNGLLKQGATLVTEAADIVSVLQPILGQAVEARSALEEGASCPPTNEGESSHGRIIELLGPTAVAVDDLIRLSGASAGLVRMVLLELELAGRIVRREDGLIATAQDPL
jgi:DNA processing protein